VANSGTKNVSVIDTADDTIKATIALPDTQPTVHPYAFGIAVGASGQNIYVGLQDTNEVAVLDAVTKVPIKRIGLGVDSPGGLAVNDAETRLYVASNLSNTLVVIDISGTGAAEVGRITIDDAPISNPTGVVLNAAGNKAYVASSTTGNIAEVSLDETNNVYDRTATIPLGGIQPAGLSLSPDGSMLYVASLNGNVRAIKLSDKSVTNLTTADGTLALAVKPDGSKVYAPSNSTDKLYVIDSSVTPNTVLGTTYPVVAGPYGISITPDGSKLYMTMNTSSAGETVSVFNTSSNTVTGTIALPALAKPTSFGNFIGPRLQYTINATNGTNCSISPLGLIPVNDKGRVFNVSAATGSTCEVKVDGVSVGQPSAYAISGISGNHAIDASQVSVPGTYYTLTVDSNPQVGSRYLESTPAGVGAYSKSAKFLAGTVVSIKANSGYTASNWTGACSGTSGATCTITMDADKSAVADINPGVPGGPIKLTPPGTYFQDLGLAFAAAANGSTITIVAAYIPTPAAVTTTGTAGAMVTLSGGWNSDHNLQSGSTDIGDSLTITNVGVIADKLVI
jgi:DNA-binding beta-propeller fold protein YncE